MKLLKYLINNVWYLVFLLFLVIVLSFKLPYTIYAPGDIINVNERLSKRGFSNINMTSVSSSDATIPGLILAKIIPGWDIIKNEEIALNGETIIDAHNRSRLTLKESISNATYVAYQKSNTELKVKNTYYDVLYVDKKADSNIKVGDTIISYDGKSDFEHFNEYIKTKKIGDIITFKVKNEDKEYERYANIITIDNELKIGIIIHKINEYENALNYKYPKNESGASGGLMLALAIYDALTNEISADKKICGTGAISEDGTVEEISGVKYKLIGAKKAKCDLFIVPTNNYEESLNIKQEQKLDIKLINAKNFDQVLSALK